MKLELKHLAAYLPYSLSLRYKKRTEVNVVALGFYKPINTGIIYFKTDFYDLQPIHPFLPMLKPMSQLTRKELEDAGFLDKLIHQNDIVLQIENEAKLNFDIEKMPYKLAQYLLSKHYDIFDLISKGLAVEK